MNKLSKMESKLPISELFSKMLVEMKKASRKLVEESAALSRSLIISVNGEVKRIPAKDLVSLVSEKD